MDPVNRWTAGISASYAPIDMLVLTAGYTYVNAAFTEKEYKDNKVPLVSDHSIVAGVTVKPIEGFSVHIIIYRLQ
jgi:long-subunit fatty acid transport protein